MLPQTNIFLLVCQQSRDSRRGHPQMCFPVWEKGRSRKVSGTFPTYIASWGPLTFLPFLFFCVCCFGGWWKKKVFNKGRLLHVNVPPLPLAPPTLAHWHFSFFVISFGNSSWHCMRIRCGRVSSSFVLRLHLCLLLVYVFPFYHLLLPFRHFGKRCSPGSCCLLPADWSLSLMPCHRLNFNLFLSFRVMSWPPPGEAQIAIAISKGSFFRSCSRSSFRGISIYMSNFSFV